MGDEPKAKTPDPHWDLAIEIAAKLWIDGEYVVQIDPVPTQRFVDLRWAARQAGRILGGRSTVHVSQPHSRLDQTVIVTVTYNDAEGQTLRDTEGRLESALRMVLEEHADSL